MNYHLAVISEKADLIHIDKIEDYLKLCRQNRDSSGFEVEVETSYMVTTAHTSDGKDIQIIFATIESPVVLPDIEGSVHFVFVEEGDVSEQAFYKESVHKHMALIASITHLDRKTTPPPFGHGVFALGVAEELTAAAYSVDIPGWDRNLTLQEIILPEAALAIPQTPTIH